MVLPCGWFSQGGCGGSDPFPCLIRDSACLWRMFLTCWLVSPEEFLSCNPCLSIKWSEILASLTVSTDSFFKTSNKCWRIYGNSFLRERERDWFCKQHSTLHQEIQTNVCVYIMPQTILRDKYGVFNCFKTPVKREKLFYFSNIFKKNLKFKFYNNFQFILINEVVVFKKLCKVLWTLLLFKTFTIWQIFAINLNKNWKVIIYKGCRRRTN